jgi:hypothetical protein
MPLPGFNPLEKAVPPGSTEVAASQAQTARLHQRITNLERKLSEGGNKDTGWVTMTGHTHGTGWGNHSGGPTYSQRYRIKNGEVQLSGLVAIATTSGLTAWVMTVPDWLRPEPIDPTYDQEQYHTINWASPYGSAPCYMYPYTHSTLAGRIFVPAMTFTVPNWVSLDTIRYQLRRDL